MKMEISTRQVKKVILRDNVLKKVIHAETYKVLREEAEKKYKEIKDKYFTQKGIIFSCDGKKAYYYTLKKIAVILDTFKKSKLEDSYFGISRKEPNEKMVTDLFGKNCPVEVLDAIKKGKKFDNGHWIGFKQNSYEGSYCVETERFSNWNDEDSVQAGIIEISHEDFKSNILSEKYNVITDDVLNECIKLIKDKVIIETADNTNCISEEQVDKLIEILMIDRKKIEQSAKESVMKNFVMTEDMMNLYTSEILNCDKIRADLETYDKKCLEDVNAGHWELWDSEEQKDIKDGQALVSLEKSLIARNPAADIHEDGLIGIDFGTKSTIVSKRDGREKTTLIRVGTGQLNKKAQIRHYENPTIMEFIDLEKFLTDYKSREGRPETSIDDLRVSHIADNDLKSCTLSDNFYSFFYDIKQWCGDTERNIKIIDQEGKERILPAFVNLNTENFNPLELYAYYLGLYINNMRNGIYLDYVLSFPVTYEKSVKEKILASFENGLKKSLPKSIIDNKEIMSKYRVRQGVSEPAAYAITALQGYGFEPEEGENVLYSIFDFGGGTTDFDFGLWRCADEDKREEMRYDYVIEHFGSEGDKYLGGENLLELLAFEIFKANADSLGKRKVNKDSEEKSSAGFSFTKPKECDDFPGSETLISDSQEARRNTKQLMEVLRPFWEGIIGVETSKNVQPKNETNKSKPANDTLKETDEKESTDKSCIKVYNGYRFRNDEECKFPIEDDGYIEVTLFDKDGNPQAKQKLYINNKDLNIDVNLIKILEDRIGRGISNFFTSIVKAFRNEAAINSGVDGIQIFLAGNSSKSPILRKLFNEHIANEKDGKNKYILFPPLGTEEAVKMQKERKVKVNVNDITAPTGKTGVAYGLIAGREGGKIKVISEISSDAQTKFRYNIGVSKRGKFKMVLDRTLVGYGQWVRLIDAGIEDFEIYYTSLANAAKMHVDETGIYNKRCRLPYTDEDADVYIRCVEDSPEDIEYCISKDGEPTGDVEVVRVHLEG